MFEIFLLLLFSGIPITLFLVLTYFRMVDKRLKEISEDLKMFINLYLQRK